MGRLFFLTALIAASFFGCKEPSTEYKKALDDAEFFHRTLKQLTDVIVYDIFSPPVASRVYVYPCIAAYEAIVPDSNNLQSLAGQLTGFNSPPIPEQTKSYDFRVASLKAFLKTAKALVFSEDKMDAYENKLWEEVKQLGIPDDVFENSCDYGEKIADHVLEWAGKDNYKQTRTYPKYTVREPDEYWKPTPPDYMEGIEPHWNRIRPFVIDSATQFIPVRPTAFSMRKDSEFYSELVEVYETVNNLNKEQEEIAQFWDCNPYVSHHAGHVMFATKKITPGGHWVGIATISSRTAELDFTASIEAHALVTISLADAFISCWDEKWRSILVRPETLINKYIDEDWSPLLQTPPFPEYTSGHSVVSGAASTMLSKVFGENFHFRDTTEVEYGLTVREFNSFAQAAEEAAISRLYGGIHYLPACEVGLDQGKKLGAYIVKNIKTRPKGITNKLSFK